MMGQNKRVNNAKSTYMMVLTAMLAAIITVASWISIPLPFTPIPINLGTLAVTLAGAFLGYKYGPLSVLIYILLGAVGVPVFAGFTGGLGHIAGPTGGYIVGYVTSAFLCGLLIDLQGRRSPGSMSELKWWSIAAAALAGTASCYVLGTIWFMILTNTGLAASLSMCVIPFLPGDAFKITAAVLIVKAMRPLMDRMTSGSMYDSLE